MLLTKQLREWFLTQLLIIIELETIDSNGYKISNSAYEGDKTSFNLTFDETDQDNIPPFAQLTNTIPNWSSAFGVGASALTGGLQLWPIELYAE